MRGFLLVVPLFVPGVAVSLLLAIVLARSAARVLRTRAALAFLVILSIGMIVSATLSPLIGALEEGIGSTGSCDLGRVGLAALSTYFHVNDFSLNVLLFIPLGLCLPFLPRSRRTLTVALAAFAMPFAIEITQMLVPVLGRGCQSGDVSDNLFGLVLGMVAGAILSHLTRLLGLRGT